MHPCFRLRATFVMTLTALMFGSTAVALAGGAGDFAPPATKKQCLAILKKDRRMRDAEIKAHPAAMKAAQAKIAAAQSKYAALKAQYDAIQPQIDAIMNTDTSGFTQDQVDALNTQINDLVAKQRALKSKVDVAGGKVDEAKEARKTVAKKYADDMKNWPKYLKQVAAYCAKM
jgi:chromosome segregation ATPase